MTEVLYLSYDGMTDPLGQSQVIPYLAGLSAKGYHFHLISFEKPDAFKENQKQVSEMLKSHGIEWHPLPYTKNPPVVSTMIDLRKMIQLGSKLVSEHHIQIVHCRSYISGIAGLKLKDRFQIRMIFDMRGFWADERVDGGIWNLSNPIYNFIYQYFKRKEKQLISKSDAVVSLTSNAKEVIDSWKLRSAAQLPLQIIPCCVDMKLFDPAKVSHEEKSALRQALNLNPVQPVITYLGAVGTWYLLDDMLKFFQVFLKKYPDAIFLFITRESEDLIKNRSRALEIPDKHIRVFKASRNQVPVALSLGNISMFFIKPAFSKRASSPTKQGEIMSMGIPVICNIGVGDTDSVVNKYHSGVLVDTNNPESYLEAVEQYQTVLEIPATDIISGAKEFYSLESGVEKYAAIYKSLLD